MYHSSSPNTITRKWCGSTHISSFSEARPPFPFTIPFRSISSGRGGFGNCLPALQPPLLRGISAYSRIGYMIEIDHGHGDWYVSTEARVAGEKNELILGDFRYM